MVKSERKRDGKSASPANTEMERPKSRIQTFHRKRSTFENVDFECIRLSVSNHDCDKDAVVLPYRKNKWARLELQMWADREEIALPVRDDSVECNSSIFGSGVDCVIEFGQRTAGKREIIVAGQTNEVTSAARRIALERQRNSIDTCRQIKTERHVLSRFKHDLKCN